MSALVELRGVTKRFGAVVAVSRIDLQINQGEFLTLLGPSGCGKTTALRMISGLETPDEGAIFLDGRDITHLPPYRRDMNQVFQSYALFPHLSVAGNIAFGLRMKRLARSEIEKRVADAVELVSLAGLENRMPVQLSGGQKQRVALARAIVNRPRVLLLDEPLAALDAKLRRAMQVELKRLQARLGITFVFVTHDQEEALTMSDRIAVMNAGRFEQLGRVSEVYHRPRTSFVAGFLGHANIFPAKVIARSEHACSLQIGDSIVLRAGPCNADSVLVSIRPERVQVNLSRAEGENTFEACVVEALFKGHFDQLLVRAGAIELSAIVQNQSASDIDFRVGQRVNCHIHPGDIAIVSDN